jgi:hypothetical protein
LLEPAEIAPSEEGADEKAGSPTPVMEIYNGKSSQGTEDKCEVRDAGFGFSVEVVAHCQEES